MTTDTPTVEGLACAVEDGVPTVRFTHTVGLDRAPELLDEAAWWLAHRDTRDFRVDLRAVERATSVLLALLLELIEIARAWRGRMTVRVEGADFGELADFYGVRDLLTIREETP